MPLAKGFLHLSLEEDKQQHKKTGTEPPLVFHDCILSQAVKKNNHYLQLFTKGCFIFWLLHCPLLVHRRKSKAYAHSGGSNTKGSLNKDEWETILINTYWIHPVYSLVLLLESSCLHIQGKPEE